MTNPSLIITSYQHWVCELVDQGMIPYLMTFTFRELDKGPSTSLAIMLKEVDRVYATHATRVVRNPRGEHAHRTLPIWIVSPDYPVFKHERGDFGSDYVNDGLHTHTIGLYHSRTRLKVPVEDHFDKEQKLYTPPDQPLFRIDVVPIERKLARTVDYTMKSLKRRRVGIDNLHILPRCRSELVARGA